MSGTVRRRLSLASATADEAVGVFADFIDELLDAVLVAGDDIDVEFMEESCEECDVASNVRSSLDQNLPLRFSEQSSEKPRIFDRQVRIIEDLAIGVFDAHAIRPTINPDSVSTSTNVNSR